MFLIQAWREDLEALPVEEDVLLDEQPNQDRSRVTVETIVETTTRIIEAEGLEGLTTNRVARVAGVSVGSLYQYFPNKEALVHNTALSDTSRLEDEAWVDEICELLQRYLLRDDAR